MRRRARARRFRRGGSLGSECQGAKYSNLPDLRAPGSGTFRIPLRLGRPSLSHLMNWSLAFLHRHLPPRTFHVLFTFLPPSVCPREPVWTNTIIIGMHKAEMQE